MNNLILIIANIAAISAGGVMGVIVVNMNKSLSLESYKERSDKQAKKAKEEIKSIELNAKERVEKTKQRIFEYEEKVQQQLKKREALIESKEDQVKRKEGQFGTIKGEFKLITKEVDQLENKNEDIKKEFKIKLYNKTGFSEKGAKEEVMEKTIRDLELMKDDRLRRTEEYLEENKVRIAKDILVDAIQRYSAPTSVEKQSLAVIVKRDELKGKIIGPEAKFLKLLEELTECEIIFNDAPNTIIISCMDLVKKHIARETILKLLKEKDVTEEKIKRTIEVVKKEMELLLIKIGKDTIKKLGLDKRRKYPDDFCKIMGRLQFRTSYGQNIMKHSYEVGFFTLMLAGEIGANMEISRIAGFFHDLGKAIDYEEQKPHDYLTKEIMENVGGFSEEEIHAAWNHHDAIEHKSAESMLVKAADAISAGRPGARQETLEKFLEHVRMIESVASSYEGVKKSYAISAGRELRVFVEPQSLKDKHLVDLAKSIAGEIEEQKAYPGKIKINIIRRTNSIEYAKKK